MERGDLTQKVVSTASLLFEAVKKLEEDSTKPGSSTAATNSRLIAPAPSPSNVRSELSNLFSWNSGSSVGKGKRSLSLSARSSKKKKLKTWTHTFVCLASTGQHYIPDTNERTSLKLAGLGEKRFPVFAYSTAPELQEELYREFPKLAGSGGYELLRASEVGGRELVVIDMPQDGYCVEYLQAVVKSGKIYIRPLQKDLDGTPLESKLKVEETCLTCGKLVPLNLLKVHLEECKKSLQSPSPPYSPVPFSFSPSPGHDRCDSPCPFQGSSPQRSAFFEDVQEDSDIVGVDNELLRYVQDISQKSDLTTESDCEIKHLEQLILHLRKKHLTEDTFQFVVNRENVIADALKRTRKPSFRWNKQVEVFFIGESGSDGGGLTREFFTLFAKEMSSKYLEKTGTFRHNAVALQENVYFKLGQIVSMGFLQGGVGFHVLCTSVYNYLTGMKVGDIIVDICEVGDFEIKDVLNQILQASTERELRNVVCSNFPILMDCGFVKPSTSITMEDRVEVIQALALHQVILKSKGELDQFAEGLDSCGVLGAMKSYSDLTRKYFTIDGYPQLTSGRILKLFKEIKYSAHGSNDRKKEEKTFGFFVDYLDECENATATITLEKVLYFFTGAEEVPPTGYGSFSTPTIRFNHKDPYPTASTCAIELTLPTLYHKDPYSVFKEAMNTAMVCHGGFGLA